MKKLLKWAGIIIGVLIVVGIIASLGGDGEETKIVEETKEEATVEEVVEETETEEPAEASEPEVATLKIGDTGQGENWDYTVNSFEVKDKLTQEYGDPVEAGEGQKFLIVNVTFKNRTKETKDISGFSSFDFKALATGGFVFDEDSDTTIFDLENDYYDIGDIAPGGSAAGNIAFKISADATGLQLKVGYDDLIWDLQ